MLCPQGPKAGPAYLNADDNVPQKIKTALHKAAEIACGNVPEMPGPVVIERDRKKQVSICRVTRKEGEMTKRFREKFAVGDRLDALCICLGWFDARLRLQYVDTVLQIT